MGGLHLGLGHVVGLQGFRRLIGLGVLVVSFVCGCVSPGKVLRFWFVGAEVEGCCARCHCINDLWFDGLEGRAVPLGPLGLVLQDEEVLEWCHDGVVRVGVAGLDGLAL